MATSGSTDYADTRTQILTDAHILVGAISEDETLSSNQEAVGARFLNRMLKAWQAQGIHLWRQTEGVLFLQKSTQSYSLGPSGDNATESYVSTTLSADASSGATSISVASATGIADTYYIGVELDSGSLDWTTVSGAPAGTTVTLAAGLDGDASSGNTVYVYQTKIERPLRLLHARIVLSGGNEYPLELISRDEYFDLANKSAAGKANQLYYDPQLTNGKAYVWPAADSVDDLIKFTFERTFEDMDAASNNPDFPQEWLEAITNGLAYRLAKVYHLPEPEIARLRGEAEQSLEIALGFDREYTSISFGPEIR